MFNWFRYELDFDLKQMQDVRVQNFQAEIAWFVNPNQKLQDWLSFTFFILILIVKQLLDFIFSYKS